MAVGGLPAEALPTFAAGAVMLALAGALLLLDFRHRLNRALALFLVLRGVLNVVAFAAVVPGLEEWSARVAPYFHIAVPFAAGYFGWRYARWSRGAAPDGEGRGGVPLALLAAALAFEAAYALDHGLWSRAGRLEALGVFIYVKFLAYAAIAYLLLREGASLPEGPRRRSARVVALGFALSPLYLAAKSLGLTGLDLAAAGAARLDEPGIAASRVVLGAVLVLLAGAAWHGVRGSAGPRERRRLVLALGLAGGSAAAVLAGYARSAALGGALDIAADGAWSLALPVLVTYAIVRHQLFGIDLTVKQTIRQSTVVGAFVAVFFVASETAEGIVADNVGALFGLGAAAVLTMAQGPLQRWAERVSDAIMPGVQAPEHLRRDQRRGLYLDQARALLEDGAVSARDRRVLEVARDRLGLTREEAAMLERAALRELQDARPAAQA